MKFLWDSSGGIAIGYWPNDRRFEIVSRQRQETFLFSQLPALRWLSGTTMEESGRGVKLTNHLSLVSRLRICGSAYTSSWRSAHFASFIVFSHVTVFCDSLYYENGILGLKQKLEVSHQFGVYICKRSGAMFSPSTLTYQATDQNQISPSTKHVFFALWNMEPNTAVE